MDTGSFQG